MAAPTLGATHARTHARWRQPDSSGTGGAVREHVRHAYDGVRDTQRRRRGGGASGKCPAIDSVTVPGKQLSDKRFNATLYCSCWSGAAVHPRCRRCSGCGHRGACAALTRRNRTPLQGKRAPAWTTSSERIARAVRGRPLHSCIMHGLTMPVEHKRGRLNRRTAHVHAGWCRRSTLACTAR